MKKLAIQIRAEIVVDDDVDLDAEVAERICSEIKHGVAVSDAIALAAEWGIREGLADLDAVPDIEADVTRAYAL